MSSELESSSQEDHDMTTRSRIALAALPILVALFLAGCPTRISIADINRDPGRYAGKEVTIAGRVSDSMGALGTGAFQVDDGTGRMWVMSEKYGVPANDAKVSVTGRVQQGFSFGGRSFGVILRETQPRR
jgi:hypothetical protein